MGSALEKIINNFDVFVLDIFGIIHDGVQLYPGALDMIKNINKSDKKVIFLSNAPRCAQQTSDILAKFGITRDMYSNIFTSGELFLSDCKAGKLSGKYFAFGKEKDIKPLDEFTDMKKVENISDANYIITFGATFANENELLEQLKCAKNNDAKMICVNPDIIVFRQGVKELCAGYLGQIYEQIGGSVVYYGKPYSRTYENLFEKMEIHDKNRVIAMGDSMETDIKGAHHAGISSALVLTGVHHNIVENQELNTNKLESLFSEFGFKPSFVIKDLTC